jgi:hypothetical protein
MTRRVPTPLSDPLFAPSPSQQEGYRTLIETRGALGHAGITLLAPNGMTAYLKLCYRGINCLRRPRGTLPK